MANVFEEVAVRKQRKLGGMFLLRGDLIIYGGGFVDKPRASLKLGFAVTRGS
jgi:hypothetical protein